MRTAIVRSISFGGTRPDETSRWSALPAREQAEYRDDHAAAVARCTAVAEARTRVELEDREAWPTPIFVDQSVARAHSDLRVAYVA